MSVLLGRVGCGLLRRRGPTRKRVAERAVHHGDLLLLIDDDLLCKTLEPLVLPGRRHEVAGPLRFEFPAGSRYDWLAGSYLIA
jgi:hypothetical protein